MKLVKRILSAICALTMVSSLVTFTMANAAGEPVIGTKVVDYNPETGIGKLEVSISDVDTYCAANAIQGFEVHLEMDSTVFDTAYYAKGTVLNAPYKKNNMKMDGAAWIDVTSGEACGLFTPGVYDSTKGELVTTGANMLFIEASNLFYINFKVLDPTKDATIGVSNCIINGLDLNSGLAVETKQAAGQIIADDVVIKAPAAATATPTPTPVVTPEPTPEVTPEPTATPEPTEGKGVETFSATDAAAWAWETAAVAGSKVKVTVTDGTTEGAKTFDLNAAVEGSVKVGVIVQYNPTAFPNFAIVDVEIQ